MKYLSSEKLLKRQLILLSEGLSDRPIRSRGRGLQGGRGGQRINDKDSGWVVENIMKNKFQAQNKTSPNFKWDSR